MTDVAVACKELATLAPLLGPALTRDRIGGGTFGRLEPALPAAWAATPLEGRRMTDLPQAALDAVDAALAALPEPPRPQERDRWRAVSRIALNAAAPHIAAAERKRILDALPFRTGSSMARIITDALGSPDD